MEDNALDTSYFLPIDTQGTETEYLVELARNVGNYLYEYKDQFKDESGANDKLNLGIMAQQVAQVPGLNAAIIQNPNDGSLSVDANRLALSTLGYVATLARLVLDMRGIDYDRPDKEMAGNIPDSRADGNGNGGILMATPHNSANRGDFGKTVLTRAEEITRSTEAQIFVCYFKAVCGSDHCINTCFGIFAFIIGNKDTV